MDQPPLNEETPVEAVPDPDAHPLIPPPDSEPSLINGDVPVPLPVPVLVPTGPISQVPPALPRANAEGEFFVQVLATAHEDSICEIWDTLRTEFPDLLEFASRSITRTETGDNKVLFRLRIGAFMTRQAAGEFCAHLEVAGHNCFVP